MRRTVKLHKLGDSSDEVVVVELYVKSGERVKVGDPLLRVETSKTDVDVESPVAGTLIEMLVAVDDEISTGTPIAAIEG